MNNLNELAKQIYEGNKLRGFDVSKENIGQTLMLVVSELSEALEADRLNKYADMSNINQLINDGYTWDDSPISFEAAFRKDVKDSFQDEIMDSFIRLFDLCGGLNIDIEKYMSLKLKFNSTREYKHGKRY